MHFREQLRCFLQCVPLDARLDGPRFGETEDFLAFLDEGERLSRGRFDACLERGIEMYGGGQYELGVGRGQVQEVASLFYPDTPNDVAPPAYNAPEPMAGLPDSPLSPPPRRPGLGW